MTEPQRAEAIEHRRLLHRPLHGPPHFNERGRHRYHLIAANYQHQTIIGQSLDRMTGFSQILCSVLDKGENELHAWCVLPNHWHALIGTDDLKKLLSAIGKLHGRTSFEWNGEEEARGRQCWHRCADRRIRSEAHLHAVRNYIHHNPVKHGYVTNWEDWPWSSASDYLQEVGLKTARIMWEQYPILDMGKGWDENIESPCGGRITG